MTDMTNFLRLIGIGMGLFRAYFRFIVVFIVTFAIALAPVSSRAHICSDLLQTYKRLEVRDRVKVVLNTSILHRLPYDEREFLRSVLASSDDVSVESRERLNQIGVSIHQPDFANTVLTLKKRSLVERWAVIIKSFTSAGSTVPGPHRLGLWSRIFGTFKDGIGISIEALIWLLNPIPKSNYIYNRSIRSIYKKIRENPSYVLLDKEKQLLEQQKLNEDLELYRQMMKSESPIRSYGRKLVNGLVYQGPKIASLLTILLLLDKGHAITSSNYIESIYDNKLDESRIEVLLDVTVFPHTAIRIDDLVYSPSQAMVIVTPVSEYFNTEKTGSVMTLNIKLDNSTVSKIKAEFEGLAWKNYSNVTGIYDCTTVVNDVLQKIAGIGVPQAISASPTLAMAWWKSEGSLGDNRFGNVQFVHMADRNPTINRFVMQALQYLEHSVEAKVFYFFALRMASSERDPDSNKNLYWQSATYKEKIDDVYTEQLMFLEQTDEVADLIRLVKILEVKSRTANPETTRASAVELKDAIHNFFFDRITVLTSTIDTEVSATLKSSLEAEKRALVTLNDRLQRQIDSVVNKF